MLDSSGRWPLGLFWLRFAEVKVSEAMDADRITVSREKLMEALAYSWVLGWYAGCGGVTNDSGKVEAATELLRRVEDPDELVH